MDFNSSQNLSMLWIEANVTNCHSDFLMEVFMIGGGKQLFGLYKRSNGIWSFYVYQNGRRVQRSTGERTKAKATKVMMQFLDRENEVSTSSFLTFGEFSKGVFDYDTGPIVKRKTLRGYSYSKSYARDNQRYVDKYIVPFFGRYAIDSIKPNDVEWWLLAIPERHGVGNKTANCVLGAFRAVFAEAQMQGLIASNPAAVVKPLSKRYGVKPRGCYTMEQVHRIFSERWNNLSYAACLLAATTGMRMGEVRALTVEQIHEDYIEVNASWSDLEGRKCTKSGWDRIVPLSPDVKAVLDEIMPPCGLVFTLNGSKPVEDKCILKYLYRRMDDLEIDHKVLNLTFHSFRHYFNTRLVAAGIQGEKVRAVMGHESEQMTEHYMHLSVDDMLEVRGIQRLAVGF